MSKYLIVGGVAGGATTGARLRRLDEKSEIIIFERSEYVSYANCGLPYYIGGSIQNRDDLFVQTPSGFKTRFNIDVRTNSEVININRESKHIEIKNLITSEVYTETYDKLILAPGAEPIIPNIEGIRSPGIFTLRNVRDTDTIAHYINSHNPKQAVIIGAGFIGIEMAENLYERGLQITIVEMIDQVMSALDFEMASSIHIHLKMKKISLILKDGVSSFKTENGKIIITLQSGKTLSSDMVILSIGVKPENILAKESGLSIGKSGGIAVNEHLQTSDPDVYALGDAIEFNNPILNRSITSYLAGPANKQGRLVADNIVFGNRKKYSGTIGTAIAKVFDLSVASTGISEKRLKLENIPHLAAIVHVSSHASYYPNAKPLSIKLIFSPDTGKILGAQIVGYEGVDKRIDMIASVLKFGGTIFDLGQLDHAYAPPYSSAKDPVNIAGFVAENIFNGLYKPIYWHEILTRNKNETFLVDVRTPAEYRSGTIDNAVNIPVDVLRSRIHEIPRDKKIIVFCGVGLRAYISTRILIQNGFDNVYDLIGGYKTFASATQDIGLS